MGSMFKALMLHTEVWRHEERNPHDCLNYELNQMLFIWTPFLHGRITNKPWLFRSGYLVGALLGNKQNEATSRKTTNSILLLIIKCKLSGQNSDVEKLISTTMSLTASQYLEMYQHLNDVHKFNEPVFCKWPIHNTKESCMG